MVAQQRVGYGFDVPRKRGESNFTTSWDPCNMYIPDRCLAQVKSCVVAKSTALLTYMYYNVKIIVSIVNFFLLFASCYCHFNRKELGDASGREYHRDSGGLLKRLMRSFRCQEQSSDVEDQEEEHVVLEDEGVLRFKSRSGAMCRLFNACDALVLGG